MNDMYGSDPPERIQTCLNCQYNRCVNCFERVPTNGGKPRILKINPENEEIVTAYSSVREAARVHGVSKHKIGGAISKQSIFLGYLWRRSYV